MFYYTTAERIAFMGYDNSEGKMLSAANVSIANNIVTVNSLGTTVVGTLEATAVSATGNVTGGNVATAGVISATGNITGGNLRTSAVTVAGTGAITGITTLSASGNANVGNLGATNVVATSITGTLATNAQPNITSVGTLSSLSVTGNITGGNIIGLVSQNTRRRTLNFVIDGGGSTITTGSKGFVVIDANCTILSWTILNDSAGNANVDVKRGTYSGFPTTTSITGNIPPTTTDAQKNQNTTLSGWGNTTIAAGDVLEFVVQGTPANVARTTISLSLVSSS
jgi:hypothetical protein